METYNNTFDVQELWLGNNTYIHIYPLTKCFLLSPANIQSIYIVHLTRQNSPCSICLDSSQDTSTWSWSGNGERKTPVIPINQMTMSLLQMRFWGLPASVQQWARYLIFSFLAPSPAPPRTIPTSLHSFSPISSSLGRVLTPCSSALAFHLQNPTPFSLCLNLSALDLQISFL